MQYGVSAFYHTFTWSRKKYLLLRRFDHAAIFVLIAGSATPIVCLA
jgi:hemolysin III